MIYKYKDSEIFYKFIGDKNGVVNVYLHGWGCDYKSLEFCAKYLKGSSLLIDLPPFGKSDKNICGWTIFTYTTMVINLCDHLGIHKVNLIGHSFGGRVAILFSVFCKNKVQKVVLIDSAGLKPRRSLLYYIKIWRYKLRKKLKLDISKFGSCDYKVLTPNMKKIFNSVVRTYLDDFLPFIQAKTLIVFGKNDKTTPVYMAKKLHKKIKNSELTILPNAGHFCFLDRKLTFLKLLNNFLTKEE